MDSLRFDRPKFRLAGDRGLLVEFGDAITPEINQSVRAMTFALETAAVPGVREVIPTYRSVVVVYDPLTTNPSLLSPLILSLHEGLARIDTPAPKESVIPVCYGGEYGPDIAFVAEHNHIGTDDVIRLHSEPSYPIYMLGFSPGFPFLGGLSEKLHTPRLTSPRMRVLAGSVGIANNQTGIYPIASPGGWQLIGRSPVRLFDPERPDPFLLRAGDTLRFEPITPDEYQRRAVGDEHD
ncbi:5-oxoprolinase subunit PxpB [Desulfosarcina sp.]|uniref:5-oxoprolinase subunit PxpB n=1 Tax=Desulfosarcina sp. TaxID=2027861 RepID=UPI0029BBC7A5|nr:5-oxoprolinase subunit PxpB [Desulfosarcina sp.]MDX2452840.1 5-oxoprolinase subunit PxpB [Desulfosarcina sp.]MDX2490584.1 5-oxoprolinase subunit PxpB [Desulfosarcina sp.]